jgi:DEAD/DEAH box helicase domain-containing protein
MKDKYIVLDVETKKSFDEVGGRNFEQLGISVAGIYRQGSDKYEAYEENQLSQLNQILSEADLVIGFNIKGFDYVVLQPYLEIPLSKLPTLDILEDIKTALGHRVSLNSAAKATLGKEKTGDGLEALRLYKIGEIEKIKKYCLNDVQITKEIYEFGLKNRYIRYLSKDGRQILEVKIGWTPVHSEQGLLF